MYENPRVARMLQDESKIVLKSLCMQEQEEFFRCKLKNAIMITLLSLVQSILL